MSTQPGGDWRPLSQWRLAMHDLMDGLRAHRVWMMLASMDIRQRYRRSVIGPFWITITMVIWFLAMVRCTATCSASAPTSSSPTSPSASSPGA